MVWWELELHIKRAHSEWQDRLDPWRRSYNDVEWYESEAGGGADNGNNSTLTYARAAPRSSTVFDSTLGFPGEGPAQPLHEGALNASQGSAETDSPGHRRQDWVVRRRMRRRRARQQRGGIRACFLDLCRMGIDLSARKGGEVPTGLHTAAAAVCARLIHQATLMVTAARRKQITGPRRRVRRRRARKLAGIRARARDLHAGNAGEDPNGPHLAARAVYARPARQTSTTKPPASLVASGWMGRWQQILLEWQCRQLALRASAAGAVAAFRQRRRGASKEERLWAATAARRGAFAKQAPAKPGVVTGTEGAMVDICRLELQRQDLVGPAWWVRGRPARGNGRGSGGHVPQARPQEPPMPPSNHVPMVTSQVLAPP